MSLGHVELQDLLKQVSRSFYLTIRVLPSSIRRPIGIAYMLARASDTVADTQLIQVDRRREALLQIRDCVRAVCGEGEVAFPEFGDLAEAQQTSAGEGNPAERILLQRFGELLDVLRTFPPEDRLQIGRVLDTITRGQESDLLRFAGPGNITALATEDELDRYIYEVAGCVGEFWSAICRTHLFPQEPLDEEILQTNGIRFGKGLQLVNVLRDLPKDLRRGRCYIPLDQLASHGLCPSDLLDQTSMDRFRLLYERYLSRAEDHLAAGWRYTIALPFRCMRVRLACAWPLLIGASTLQELRRMNVLDDSRRLKIGRSEVRHLILRSSLLYLYPPAWNRLFDSARAPR
jgi:farnesyl-diphosphate farnesyltransferase